MKMDLNTVLSNGIKNMATFLNPYLLVPFPCWHEEETRSLLFHVKLLATSFLLVHITAGMTNLLAAWAALSKGAIILGCI